jgi:hypothetical protein
MFQVVDRVIRAVNIGTGQKNINFPQKIENALFPNENDLKKIQYIILSDNITNKKLVVVCGIDDYQNTMNIINKKEMI